MAKRKKMNRKIKEKSRKKGFNALEILGIVLVSILLILLVISLILPKHENKTGVNQSGGIKVPQSHYNVTNSEATTFYKQNVLPIIRDAHNDPIPEIKEIMSLLDEFVKERKVEIGIASTYKETALASTYQAQNNNSELWITFSGPLLMDHYEVFRPSAFRDLVIFAICHETLHVLNDPVFVNELYKIETDSITMDKDRLNGEVLVWGLTVQKIIRPMLREGRYIGPEEIEASQLLEKLGDDSNDPKWIQWIKDNRFTPTKENQ